MKFHLPTAVRQLPNGTSYGLTLNYSICHQNNIGSKLSGKKILDGKLASSPLLVLQQVDYLPLVVNSARSSEFDKVSGKKIAGLDRQTRGLLVGEAAPPVGESDMLVWIRLPCHALTYLTSAIDQFPTDVQ
jgi:hypothetical protein